MTEEGQRDHVPDQTRRRLLEIAFEEIYREGFQGLRIGTVIDKAGLTKGAIYHYFPSKQALGYAVVEEVIAARMKQIWLDTFEQESDPAAAIAMAFEKAKAAEEIDIVKFGCPLNNLAQEMSPIDAGFRDRIRGFFRDWRDAVAAALERGKTEGVIRQEVDSPAAATYIIASIEGCIGLAKNEGDAGVVTQCMRELGHYFDTLRPTE